MGFGGWTRLVRPVVRLALLRFLGRRSYHPPLSDRLDERSVVNRGLCAVIFGPSGIGCIQAIRVAAITGDQRGIAGARMSAREQQAEAPSIEIEGRAVQPIDRNRAADVFH